MAARHCLPSHCRRSVAGLCGPGLYACPYAQSCVSQRLPAPASFRGPVVRIPELMRAILNAELPERPAASTRVRFCGECIQPCPCLTLAAAMQKRRRGGDRDTDGEQSPGEE